MSPCRNTALHRHHPKRPPMLPCPTSDSDQPLATTNVGLVESDKDLSAALAAVSMRSVPSTRSIVAPGASADSSALTSAVSAFVPPTSTTRSGCSSSISRAEGPSASVDANSTTSPSPAATSDRRRAHIRQRRTVRDHHGDARASRLRRRARRQRRRDKRSGRDAAQQSPPTGAGIGLPRLQGVREAFRSLTSSPPSSAGPLQTALIDIVSAIGGNDEGVAVIETKFAASAHQHCVTVDLHIALPAGAALLPRCGRVVVEKAPRPAREHPATGPDVHRQALRTTNRCPARCR